MYYLLLGHVIGAHFWCLRLTCGGLQSAHSVALSAAAAELGMACHVLVRGEKQPIPSGNHLLARMFSKSLQYVPRHVYADRESMFACYTRELHKQLPPEHKIAVVQEGAAEPHAMLGLLRLVHYLQRDFGQSACKLVVDSGTGATAVGLSIGIALLQLPWTVVGVMLAGTVKQYTDTQIRLSEQFQTAFGTLIQGGEGLPVNLPLIWVPRIYPRRFGDVLPGEIAACSQIAKEHGILLDPIYSLAAWEMACKIANDEPANADILMLHSGGSLGLHGLAQRFPEQF
eukprot:jgi/Botrbrau1/19906/Bobra.0059s0025.2